MKNLSFAILIAIVLCARVMGQPSIIRYEAEDSFHVGKLHSVPCNLGTTSSEFSSVNDGATLVFTVNVPFDGVFPVTIRYTHCQSLTNSISVKISTNGYEATSSSLPTPTTSWADKEEMLKLRTGLNTIEYIVQGGNIAVDYITIKGGIKLADRGATSNYVEYQAEAGNFVGTKIGPDKIYTHLPSEATGRQAVQLSKSGDFVEFLLTASANAVVIRYSIPDSSTGTGLWALLSIYIDGTKFQTLNITSVYSWCYGPYPSSKHPSDSAPHHFFDDIRVMFKQTLSAGTKVRVQGDSPQITYTIDVADFYSVPDPYPMPAGYLSVVDYGADPSGVKDSADAFNKTIAAAKGNGVWIPAGIYSMSSRVIVDQVTVRGAGPWYSEMHGMDFGFFGNWAPNPSTNVKIYDLAIFGKTITRDDMEISTGIGGALTSTIIQNIWIEHNKCGMWLDGPFHDMLITGVTIRNTFADGINFHRGIQNSVVEQTIIRNSGDDCLAMWPEQPGPYGGNTFKFNTLSLPILANTIAIYGGDSNSATDNLVSDTLSFGAGVQIGARYGSVALSGTTTSARNSLFRTGSTGYGGNGYGAIWLFAENSPIATPVVISDHVVSDSYYAGIQFYQGGMNDIVFTNITIDNADYAIEERTQGSATFNYVVATNLHIGGQWNCGAPFKIILGDGNSGWSNVNCTPGLR